MSLPTIAALTPDQIKESRIIDKLDSPLDYLSINYEMYVNKIFSLSITEPSKYYQLRNKLTSDLNVKILEYVHNILFDLLRYGQIGGVSYTEGHMVGYPCEKVNKIAMDISVLFKGEIDKVICLLLPPDNQKLANTSLRSKHLSTMIDIPTATAT